MIQAVMQAGTRRCRWVVCDEAFGRDTTLLDNIAGLGLWYFAEVPHDTRVWQVRPGAAVPRWSGRGRKPTRARLVEGSPAPATVAEVAAAMPADAWSRQSMKEGSQGPVVAEFAVPRVIAVRHGLPGPESWLVLRRTPVGELKAYLCNSPRTPRPPVWCACVGGAGRLKPASRSGSSLRSLGTMKSGRGAAGIII